MKNQGDRNVKTMVVVVIVNLRIDVLLVLLDLPDILVLTALQVVMAVQENQVRMVKQYRFMYRRPLVVLSVLQPLVGLASLAFPGQQDLKAIQEPMHKAKEEVKDLLDLQVH